MKLLLYKKDNYTKMFICIFIIIVCIIMILIITIIIKIKVSKNEDPNISCITTYINMSKSIAC